MWDIVIVGAGPAGLTAALYGARAGLSVLTLEESLPGGQLILTAEVENYPSWPSISGWDLAEKLRAQAQEAGAELRRESALSLEAENGHWAVATARERYETRSVILATGARRRHLGCPGEEELAGRGVSYCAVCDGAFFRNRPVLVVGGGSTALEDALYLAKLCPRVTLVCRRDRFRGEKRLQDAVLASEVIEVFWETELAAIEGGERVERVRLKGRHAGELAVAGVFIAIGLAPDNARFAGAVALDEGGYVLAGEDCRTGAPGVFAAGDCRAKPLRQILTAASDGAVAAKAAADYCAGHI